MKTGVTPVTKQHRRSADTAKRVENQAHCAVQLVSQGATNGAPPIGAAAVCAARQARQMPCQGLSTWQVHGIGDRSNPEVIPHVWCATQQRVGMGAKRHCLSSAGDVPLGCRGRRMPPAVQELPDDISLLLRHVV